MLSLDYGGRQQHASTDNSRINRRGTTNDHIARANNSKQDEDTTGKIRSPVASASKVASMCRADLRLRLRADKRQDDPILESSDIDQRSVCANNKSEVGSVANSSRVRAQASRSRIDRHNSLATDPLVFTLPAHDASFSAIPKEAFESEDSVGQELEFSEVEPIPMREKHVQDASNALKLFCSISRDESLISTPPVLPQRYFYGRDLTSPKNRSPLIKMKVVNVGPDTPNLQLPAYTQKLVELVRERRCRLKQIRRGSAMFTHENLVILEYELELYEKSLRNALRMLRNTCGALANTTAARPAAQRSLATKTLRPVPQGAILRENLVVADISVSGVTDLLSTDSDTEITSVLEEEVAELRKSLRRVREDIAFMLEEEVDACDEPPLHHIRATRQCSIHSLSST